MVWTCDEDWVKKSMEYRVEGRRPVERQKKTWLEECRGRQVLIESLVIQASERSLLACEVNQVSKLLTWP